MRAFPEATLHVPPRCRFCSPALPSASRLLALMQMEDFKQKWIYPQMVKEDKASDPYSNFIANLTEERFGFAEWASRPVEQVRRVTSQVLVRAPCVPPLTRGRRRQSVRFYLVCTL